MSALVRIELSHDVSMELALHLKLFVWSVKVIDRKGKSTSANKEAVHEQNQ